MKKISGIAIPALLILSASADAGTFRDCAECPVMVVVPAGKGRVGTEDAEWPKEDYKSAPVSEMPAHDVTIARPFAIGQMEITREQYAFFAKASGYPDRPACVILDDKGDKVLTQGYNRKDPRFKQTSDQEPVVCISYDDAAAYVRWLSTKTGRRYRLPSEVEWEYAARAGTNTSRYWGDSAARDQACTYGSVADQRLAAYLKVSTTPDNIFQCTDGYDLTSPVGRFKPNAFGLYDMLGNVSEWVADCFHAGYSGAPVDGSVWSEGCAQADGQPVHVARGGAFGTNPGYTRAAWRSRLNPRNGYFHTGFRAAASVDESR